jgi:hypothetical protein
MQLRAAFGAMLLLSIAGAAAPRVEIPIRQVSHADGRLAYTFMVSVGGSTPIETTLDSGSTGLRVLPGVLGPDNVQPGDRDSDYSYASGSRFIGTIGHGVVTLGGISTDKPIAIDLISAMRCRDAIPDCPASRTDIASFGFAGDGVPGKGYKAIMGVSLKSADADNPLAAIGDGVWIIELPRPGDNTPGKLILNPAPDDLAGFTRFHLEPDRPTIPGCLLNMDNKTHVCGQVLLDTGQPGMLVTGRERPQSFPWAGGSHAVLAMQDESGAKMATGFTVIQTPDSPYSVHAQEGPIPFYRIAGSAPFFAFTVLFDSKEHVIGLKPR